MLRAVLRGHRGVEERQCLPRCSVLTRACHGQSLAHFRGMKREECVAPMPGRPCRTGL